MPRDESQQHVHHSVFPFFSFCFQFPLYFHFLLFHFLLFSMPYNTWTWWYGSIPSAITLADPCDFISLSNVVADVDCCRFCSGSIIADHTIQDGYIPQKISPCTPWIYCCILSSNLNMCKLCCSALCMLQAKSYMYINFSNTEMPGVHCTVCSKFQVSQLHGT